ncbi:MAG: HAD family hydrolase [Candidatus Marinimicrobia bacterium]|jgi:phosphoglycolate phosphatase-like HAD superfamily hydrolase|nr:HAD family hydrolase [Candidatus Neomarinimicrobiota bacterium]
MLKGIIFDFDGVIADSVQVKTDAFASLYEQYGDNIVTKVIEHHEANGGMSRFKKIKLYHESFLNKAITNEEIEDLANQFSKLVVRKVIDSPYVPGVLKYIQKCYEKYNLFISTGTPTNEIKQILSARDIAEYFIGIHGSPEKKSLHITKIISKYNYHPDELIFYGDANTDINAAKQASVPFILIKNSYNQDLVKNFKGKIINNFIGLT